MSPGKSTLKPVTPESVKILMIIELGLNIFFAYWIYSEYQYNVYFRLYVDTMLVAHITTYTAALGLTIGLTGSAIAATLYRNLKHARIRLERLAETKLKPSVQKVLEKIPVLEQHIENPVTPAGPVTTVTASTNPQQDTTTPSSGKYTIIPPPQEQAAGTSMPVLPVKPIEEEESKRT